jgi:hypothetical protein
MQVRSFTRARRVPRAVVVVLGALLSGALVCGSATVAPAEDAQVAGADLAHASDYRVRVSAALVLGRTRPEGARLMLEHALDDGHPAVRAAAAAALVAVGDAQAIPALERQLRAESSGSARSQMRSSIESLRSRGGSPSAGASQAATVAKGRYVVQLGSMRNMTGIRGGELTQVMRDAARSHAASLPGAIVVEAGDASAASRGHAGMPVLLLDGQLTRLSQQSASGTMRVQAQVEFMVRRVPQQTLKGTLSGSATTMDSVRAVTTGRVLEMQNQAVGGAVESAMRGADRGLTLAAK